MGLDFNKIEKLFKSKNLSQKEFCRLIGFSNTTYQNARNSKTTKALYVSKMAEVLEVDESSLFENNFSSSENKTFIASEPQKLYGKIATDDLLLKVLARLDRIVELLEKK